jgi:hypothetical protein
VISIFAGQFKVGQAVLLSLAFVQYVHCNTTTGLPRVYQTHLANEENTQPFSLTIFKPMLCLDTEGLFSLNGLEIEIADKCPLP